MNKKLEIILSIVLCACILGGGITGIVSNSNQNKVNERVEEQVSLINTTLDEMKSTDTTLHNNISSLTSRVTTLESTLTIVQTTINGLNDDLKENKDTLTTVQTTLTNEINLVKEDIEDLKTKDTSLQTQIDTLTRALTDEINDVKELNSKTYLTIVNWDTFKKDIDDKINSLTSRVTSIETSITTINTTLSALQIQVDKNTQDIEDLTIRVNCLEGNHVADTYNWNNDFSSCTASGHCKYCEAECEDETTTNITIDGFKYTAKFENSFSKVTIDLSDLTTVSSANYESAINIIFSKKDENVTLNLPDNFGSYEISNNFTPCHYINTAIKNNKTNVNLTLKGIKKLYLYTFEDNEYLISISLPDATEIDNNVFENCINLKYVSMPKVTKIWSDAFDSCTSLIEIELPSVTYLGDIFYHAYFKKVKLGSVITNVDNSMFNYFDTKNCVLILAKGQKDFNGKTITEKEMATGDTTFCGYEFKKIIVGEVADCEHEKMLTSYSWEADYSSCTAILFCENCAEIIDTKTANATFNGFMYSADFADERIQNSTLDLTDLTALPESMYENVINTIFSTGETDITLNLPKDFDLLWCISSAIDNGSVNVNLTLQGIEKIDDREFEQCNNLQGINLPDVVEIGDYAFNWCSDLVTVNVEKVQKIGAMAFANCDNITELTFPAVKEIGEYAFYNLNLKSLTFGSQISSIGERVFEGKFNDCVLTLAKGQKDFNGTTMTEKEMTSSDTTFCGYTFKEIIIAE